MKHKSSIRKLFLFMIFFLTLFTNFTRAENIVAAQVFTLPDSKKLLPYFATLKHLGFNTVIVKVFKISKRKGRSGVYFKTKYLNVIKNILPEIIKTAHRCKLKVIAWMNTRKFPSLLEKFPLLCALKFDLDTLGFKRTSKLSIFNLRAKLFAKKIFMDIAKTGVDGILFQDDAMLRQNEDFSLAARSIYRRVFQKSLSPYSLFTKLKYSKTLKKRILIEKNEDFKKWSYLKAKFLAEYLASLKESIKKVNPHAQVLLNCYYEVALKPQNALYWMAQDINILKNQKAADWFVIMSYHRDIKHELNLSYSEMFQKIATIAKWAKKLIRRRVNIALKIQLRDFKTKEFIDKSELKKVLRIFKYYHIKNIIYVPFYRNLI